ncbi:hypothetical protein [uncultured Lutibacter sp.]|uniref:hypothetical protein n=1 Tax=uncultured Lutibacter sp. TaxID=437739 RepID=UPI002610A7DF|nr:hypothetical protein [uncultured Lutibacter sp.]
MKNLLISFFILYSYIGYCQNNEIYKKWYLEKSILCTDGKEINDSKWSIELNNDNIAIIRLSDIELFDKQDFSIVNNQLKLKNQNYIIEKKSKDTLILNQVIDKHCKKIIFFSEKLMFENQKKKYFKHKGENIYYTNEFSSPKLENFYNYNSYFQSNIFQHIRAKKECDIILQFIITKKGELIEDKGEIDCLDKSANIVNDIFEKTKGKWTPMYINGEAVNSYVRIKLKHRSKIY